MSCIFDKCNSDNNKSNKQEQSKMNLKMKTLSITVMLLCANAAYAANTKSANVQKAIGLDVATTAQSDKVVHGHHQLSDQAEQALPTRHSQSSSDNNSKTITKTTQSSLRSAVASAAATCNDQAFVTSGTALLNEIKNQSHDCVGRLFTDAADNVRLGTFTEANIIAVAQEAQKQSVSYDGIDADAYLNSLYYWIKAAYFYGNRELLTTANQAATKAALDALVANSHFYDKTAENAAVVKGAIANFNNALLSEHYMPAFKQLLNVYDPSYEAITDWGGNLATMTWGVVKNCASNQWCRNQHFNTTFINSMGDFVHDNIDWLKKSASDYHLHNFGYQLANIYSARNDSNFSSIEATLKAQLNKVFNNFGPLPTDVGRRAYLQAMSSANYHQQCTTYNLCDSKQQIIDSVLADRISCASGSLFMWAQDMNDEQRQWACNSLGGHESYFHSKMQTNQTPVTPDDNDKLRMIVFNDKREWSIYGGALFGAGTNNGGLYLEGDPSKAGDQATFFAYEDVPERPTFDIWNLRHEYIHYLDGRFNTQGDFHDINGAGRSVWYGEGIGEYASRRDCNDDAISQAGQGTYPLSTIFDNEYGVGQTRIYPWGYLAVRFMYERHPTTFFSMIDGFRQGNYANYRTNMVDQWISQKTYDSEFAQWLPTVQSTGCSIDTSRPTSPVDPIDVDEVQGNDMVGINACAVNPPADARAKILAGKAMCLANISGGNQLQMGIYVPSGLVNVDMQLTLRHGSGDTKLLHRSGGRPNDSVHDYVSDNAGTEQTITVNDVQTGWNYVHTRGQQAFSGVTLLARYIQKGGSTPTTGTLANTCQTQAPFTSRTMTAGKAECLAASSRVSLTIPAVNDHTSIAITIGHGTGNSDVIYRNGGWPSSSTYDGKSSNADNSECIYIDNISSSNAYWGYISIEGSQANASVVVDFDTAGCRGVE
ncbi:MAG: microbial collagenase [Phenylobacterium sp.]